MIEMTKGKVPWNKGVKTGIVPKSAFKKGMIPHNKGQSKEEQLALGKKVGCWPKGVHRPELMERLHAASRGQTPWNKGLNKESAALIGKQLNGGRPIGGTPWNKGKTGVFSKDSLKKIGEGSKKWKRTPEHLQKLIEGRKAAPMTNDAKKRIGDKNRIAMIRNWDKPEYVLSQLRWRRARPNKQEKYFNSIVGKYLPEFKYNGDGSQGVVLANLVPDYVNVNGRKEVIEIFGEYWHRKQKALKWHQTELGRIMAYNSVGFRCLVIWEHEIKVLSEQEIVDKIKQWRSEYAKEV